MRKHISVSFEDVHTSTTAIGVDHTQISQYIEVSYTLDVGTPYNFHESMKYSNSKINLNVIAAYFVNVIANHVHITT